MKKKMIHWELVSKGEPIEVKNEYGEKVLRYFEKISEDDCVIVREAKDCNSVYLNSTMISCSKENCVPWDPKYITEEIDWNYVAKDQEVKVRNSEEEDWKKMHFAEYKRGKVYTFPHGMTSWSHISIQPLQEWEYAEIKE